MKTTFAYIIIYDQKNEGTLYTDILLFASETVKKKKSWAPDQLLLFHVMVKCWSTRTDFEVASILSS